MGQAVSDSNKLTWVFLILTSYSVNLAYYVAETGASV